MKKDITNDCVLTEQMDTDSEEFKEFKALILKESKQKSFLKNLKIRLLGFKFSGQHII